MKIMVYEARPDERADLEKQAALHGVELSVTDAVPTLENASLAAGCIGVSILGQGCIDAALLDAYHALGIRYLSTQMCIRDSSHWTSTMVPPENSMYSLFKI